MYGPGEPAEEEVERKVTVEEVRWDTFSTNTTMIVVLYRDPRRPECLFGYRREAMEPVERADDLPIGPGLWMTIVLANFREYVVGTPYGLPKDCSPKGMNWTI